MIVAGLLALAMIASLLLVFSESVQLLRVAVVVSLWAATVGAIAMTKYRRESALDRAKAEDLKKVYELQLQREISARREYELTVEEKVRSDLRIEADEMTALRSELATLRRTLEVLFDGRLPEDMAALEAQAQRRQELDGSTRVTAPRPSGPAFASPDDEPVTAETTLVGSDEDEVDDVRESDGGTTERAAVTEDAEDSDTGDRDTGDEDGETAEADDEPVGRRARRRRAEGAQGRSVAEILAELSTER